MHRRRNLDRERSASEIVSYRARVKYACARIHCTCFTYYRIGGIPCMESRDVFVLKIDFSPNIDEVAVTSFRHRSLSQKRLKPSLGNSNVHRQRKLDTEPSASKIVRDKDSDYCFVYVSRSRYMGTQPPPPKWGGAPKFWYMSIVAKRPDRSRWKLAWRWALVQFTLN